MRSRRRPKMIAVDLDGTFLDAKGAPHARDLRALRALAAEGVTVSILTGRLYSGTRQSALALGLIGPVGCVDGSQVVHAGDHRTLVHHGICGTNADTLRSRLAQSGAATFVFAQDTIIYDAVGDQHMHYVSTWSNDILRTDGPVFDHASWTSKIGITAVVAIGTSDQVGSASRAIREHLKDHAQVAMFPVRNHPGWWGLVARAAARSKGTALAWIADHHGYSLAETVVVGDWLNDVSMFAVAGRSFAMGHAPDEVKKAATDVLAETGDDGGGIAKIVRDVFDVPVT